MARQYLAVKFNPNDKRAYTYHHDGEHLAVGDRVSVGSGFGHVHEIVEKPTRFETKPINGPAPKSED